VPVEHDRIPDDSPRPWARFTSFQGTPEEIERTLRLMTTRVFPNARRKPGWQGVLCLTSPDRRRCLTLTFWESEAALVASSADAAGFQGQASAADLPIATIDQLQVTFRETPADTVE
jgi:heme-degrading monooxygenase HmoA